MRIKLEGIGLREEQLQLRKDPSGKTAIVCQEVEFVAEVAQDFDRLFREGRLWKELRKEESVMLVRAARKLFNDPTGGTSDSKLAAKIKKINAFVQKNYFLHDLDLKNLSNVTDFWERVGRSFDTKKAPTFHEISVSQKFNEEWTSSLRMLVREKLPPFCLSTTQIEYFLKESMEQLVQSDNKWEVYVEPNAPVDDEGEISASTARFQVNDLLVTVVNTEN